jgi:hypothetical protein
VPVRSQTQFGHDDAAALAECSAGREAVDRSKVTSLQDAARSRLARYDKNICPQCSAWLVARIGPNIPTSVACATAGPATSAATDSRRPFSSGVTENRRLARPHETPKTFRSMPVSNAASWN